MRRVLDIRSTLFLLAILVLTAAYARFSLADDTVRTRPLTPRATTLAAAPDSRLPAPDAAPRSARGRGIRSPKASRPAFVDADLRTATPVAADLRNASPGLAPAVPATADLLSPGRSAVGERSIVARPSSRLDPWSEDRLLADATNMNDAYVSLARSPVTGDLYAVFEATDLGGTDRDIHIARSSDDGLTWSLWEMPSFSQDESMPEIAIDDAGYIHVVWIRDDGYIVRTRSAAGDDPVNWSWIKGLYTGSINATPSVAVSGSGDFATVFIAASYQEINESLWSWEWTLIWMWSHNGGETVGFDALPPDGYPDLWPAVAMDGALVHMVNGESSVWGDPTRILLATDAVSGGFADVEDLTWWTGFETGFPDVACVGDAVYTVYQHDWDDGLGNVDGDIAVHLSFDGGATIDGPYEMVADAYDSLGPRIYADGDLVGCLWLETAPGGDEFDVSARQAGGRGHPEFWPDVVEVVTGLALAEPRFHYLDGVVGGGGLHAAWIDRRDYPTQGHNVYTSERALKPNLAPYTPAGWDGPLVASMNSGERIEGWLQADAPAYVSLALANTGFAAADGDVRFELRVDGVVDGAWTVPGGLGTSTFVPIEDHEVMLGAGAHLIELVLDPLGTVVEEDEGDNVLDRQWVWIDGDPRVELSPPHVLHQVEAPLAVLAADIARDAPTFRRRHLPVTAPALDAAATGGRAMLPVIVVPSLRLDAPALEDRLAGVARDLRREAVLASGRAVLDDALAEAAPLLDRLIRDGDATAPRRLWLQGAYALDLSPDGVAALAADPAVGRLWLDDRPSELFGAPAQHADEVITAVNEWHLDTVGAPAAWAEGFDGEGVLVGHIDSGAAYDHPDLMGHLWDGGAEFPNHGWDSVDDDDDPYEGDPTWNHGTHTAGLIVGDGDNGRATGAAPGATLMILRATPGYWADLIEAMQFGLDNGPVDLFSMSAGWSGPTDDMKLATREAGEFLLAAGIPWICAAGNGDGAGGHNPVPHDIATPGDVPNPWYGSAGHAAVISVGAVDIDGVVYANGSIGPTAWEIAESAYDDYPLPDGLMKPDIAAPGVDVTSLKADGSYIAWSGTSMATPLVSGAAAILLQSSPGALPADVAMALELSAVDVHDPGRDVRTGAGLLDIPGALDEIPRLGRETVVLRNTGPLPLHVTDLKWNAPWLQVTALGRTVDPADSTLVILEFDTAGLPAGLHSESVVVGSDDPDSPHAITVSLAIGDVTGIDGPPAPAAAVTGSPNPFNPRTELRFATARDGRAVLTVHDLRGRLVRTLVDGPLPAGTHTAVWDGRDSAGRALPTGLYMARLQAVGGVDATVKLTLLR